MFGELGIDPLAERPGVPHGQLARQLQGVLQHLAGQPDPGALDREARHHPAHQARHPDHEELVEVGREDGQDLTRSSSGIDSSSASSSTRSLNLSQLSSRSR